MRARIRIALALTLLATSPLPAQRDPPPVTGGFLPPAHWAVDASRRLDALGLVQAGMDASGRPLGVHEAAALFRAASKLAGTRRALAVLADGYRARIEEEYPGVAPESGATRRWMPRVVGASVAGGYLRHAGGVVTGSGYADSVGYPSLVPPSPAGDRSGLVGEEIASIALLPFLGASAAVGVGAASTTVRELYGITAWRKIGAWGGRRVIGFGAGDGGAIVLAGDVPFDGGGVFLAAPVALPWIFRYAGPLRAEAFLSRVQGTDSIRHPWFWGARASVAPHARLTVAVNRGAMFGGAGNRPVTASSLLNLLIGRHAAQSTFENQVVSVEARYRPPVAMLPSVLYAEWGFEDSAGAWKDEPGVLAGLLFPSLPRAPTLSLGIEAAAIYGSCCGNPRWYRHWVFSQGWTDRGRPLGHPLGGRGAELRVYGSADVADARLRLAAAALVRERGVENLYVPAREGRSAGGTARAAWRARRWLELSGEGAAERGSSGWRETSAMIAMRLLF